MPKIIFKLPPLPLRRAPEGVVIRNPDEFESMSLTGKKKRKRQRTDDKENPSDSKSDLKTKPETLAAKLENVTNINYYSCKIDTVSEVEIVDAVQDINYSIDNSIANILAEVKKFNLSYHKISTRTRKIQKLCDIPPNPDLDIPLLQFLLLDSPSPLSDDSRDAVVEFILHHLITSLVYKFFFKGRYFFGVGSETHHEYLETMFSELIVGENSDPAAIQRWRTMSVEAIFKMNDGIDSLLYEELIFHLERMLKVAFPLSPTPRSKKVKPESIYESIVHGEKRYLLDIIRQARKISFMIQQVVSCQVLVTTARSTQTSESPDEDILGTHSFGLQKILGPDRTMLIRTKGLTSAALRSHLL